MLAADHIYRVKRGHSCAVCAGLKAVWDRSQILKTARAAANRRLALGHASGRLWWCPGMADDAIADYTSPSLGALFATKSASSMILALPAARRGKTEPVEASPVAPLCRRRLFSLLPSLLHLCDAPAAVDHRLHGGSVQKVWQRPCGQWHDLGVLVARRTFRAGSSIRAV